MDEVFPGNRIPLRAGSTVPSKPQIGARSPQPVGRQGDLGRVLWTRARDQKRHELGGAGSRGGVERCQSTNSHIPRVTGHHGRAAGLLMQGGTASRGGSEAGIFETIIAML